MRDVKAEMKAALIDEYESYARAGRTGDAEHVAGVLQDEYGYDVIKSDDGDDAGAGSKATVAAERTDAEKPPEAAVEPKPRRTPRAKPGQTDSK